MEGVSRGSQVNGYLPAGYGIYHLYLYFSMAKPEKEPDQRQATTNKNSHSVPKSILIYLIPAGLIIKIRSLFRFLSKITIASVNKFENIETNIVDIQFPSSHYEPIRLTK